MQSLFISNFNNLRLKKLKIKVQSKIVFCFECRQANHVHTHFFSPQEERTLYMQYITYGQQVTLHPGELQDCRESVAEGRASVFLLFDSLHVWPITRIQNKISVIGQTKLFIHDNHGRLVPWLDQLLYTQQKRLSVTVNQTKI